MRIERENVEMRSKEGRGLQRKIREKEKKRESHQIIVSTYEGRRLRKQKKKSLIIKW